ncbi:MAG: nucleotide exchange factor GrpE [Lachnospiraceae bacterium]
MHIERTVNPLDNKQSKEDVIKEAVEEAKRVASEQGITEEAMAEESMTEEVTAEETKEVVEEAETDGENADEEATDATEEKKEKRLKRKNKKDKRDEKIEELTDKVTRQMAEFDNFRKRTEKEKSQMYEIGAKDVVEKILPIVDNFERGLAAVPEEQRQDPFVDGMDKIYKQMLTTLDELGVKPIEAVGNEFNPDLHNAVMHVEDEELEENIVMEEFQKGYMYRENVVRHSMVKVAN